MYNGIGLQTARGSGTNGYVQTNKFFIRPKTNKSSDLSKPFDADQGTAGVRKANTEILEHDRKRQIELKLIVLEDKLADQGYTDGEIAERVEEARSVLEMAANAAFEESGGAATALAISDTKVSDTQTHQIAARKEKQMEKLKAALGIGQDNNIGLEDGEIDDDKPKGTGYFFQNDDRKQQKKGKDHRSQKEIMEHKKHGSRKKTYEGESSGSDSEKKHKKRSKKKYHGSCESDSDVQKRRRSSKSKKRRSRASDDSDTSTNDSGKENTKKVKSSDDDSDSDSDIDKGKRNNVNKEKIKEVQSRKLDTYDSDVENKKKYIDRAHEIKGNKNGKNSDSDLDGANHHLTKKIDRSRGSKRHDSDEYDSDIDVNTKFGKSRFRKDNDLDAYGSIRLPKEKIDRRQTSRRHDTDEDDSDIAVDTKIAKRRSSKRNETRRHDTDEDDSDVDTKNGKLRSNKDDLGADGTRRQIKEKLDTRHGSKGHDNNNNHSDAIDKKIGKSKYSKTEIKEDSRGNKRIIDDANPEDVQIYKKEKTDRSPTRHVSDEDISNPYSDEKSRKSERNNKHSIEEERRSKNHSRDEEERRSKKHSRDEEERRSKKHSRDEEEHGYIKHEEKEEERGRKRSIRDDEKANKAIAKVDEDEKSIKKDTREDDEKASRKPAKAEDDDRTMRRESKGKDDEKARRIHGRVEEDDRKSGRYDERDRHADTYKRARYEDNSRASERRYDDERCDDRSRRT